MIFAHMSCRQQFKTVLCCTIFPEMRKSYLASLERREAMLLTLVDRQVEVKQEMLEEMRMENAAARARVLAAKEEGMKGKEGGKEGGKERR